MKARVLRWDTGKKCMNCGQAILVSLVIEKDEQDNDKAIETAKLYLKCTACGWSSQGMTLLEESIDTEDDYDNVPDFFSPVDMDVPDDDEDAPRDTDDVSPDDIEEGFCDVVPAALDCTKLFDPAAFFGRDWNVWKGPADGNGLSGEEEIDPRSLALTTLDPARLLLETCLREKEKTITGEEKLKRLKENPNLIRLGGNVFLALWEDCMQNEENSVLEWLYRNKKVTYLDFFGLIFRDPYSTRSVPYLYRDDDGEWYWHYHWLDDDCGTRHFSGCAQVNSLTP